jgi:hypothetical protein
LEAAADDWLSEYAAGELGKAKDGGDDEPPPLRLNYPLNYALSTWADYHRHGLMPRPGGYDAQDVAWTADMNALMRRYNWHARRLMKADDSNREAAEFSDDFEAIMQIDRVEWKRE